MPRFLVALCTCAATALMGVPMALACATPREAAMFDIAGLKSELMVTALSCNADSQYNAFVSRFQAILRADDEQLGRYFLHTYGRAGQAAHDAYITNVANKMSEVGVNEGTDFCRRHLALFASVLALTDPAELPLFAASRGYVAPVAPERCTIVASDAQAAVAQR